MNYLNCYRLVTSGRYAYPNFLGPNIYEIVYGMILFRLR